MIKSTKILVAMLLLCMLTAFGVRRDSARNTELQSLFQNINNQIQTGTIKTFDANYTAYLILAADDAEVVHLIGHMTGHDCFVEIGQAYCRNYFEKSKFDSIYQIIESMNYEISEDDLSKWLDIQNQYYDFFKSKQLDYIYSIEEYIKWTDSITDSQLRNQLLNKDGSWKECYNLENASCLTLPDSIVYSVGKLLEVYPKSKYLHCKFMEISVTKRFYDLEKSLTK